MFERRIVAAKSTTAAVPAAARAIGGEVLALLDSQHLPPSPANYALGHLVLSHPAGLAARAVDALTMGGERLRQDQADAILAAHGIASGPSEEDPAHAAIRHQALRLAELAAGTVESTGRFGRELVEQQAALGRDGIAIARIVTAMIDRAGEVEVQLAEATRQIDQLREEVEVARHDAACDALTGLDNRRGALARFAALADKRRLVVAMCDIDRFKSVNDRYGHVVGDRVLKLVAKSLAESCAPHRVARWGGEEFLVLIEGLDTAAATALIDEARVTLGERHVKLRATDEPLGAITMSAGVTPLGERALEQALHEADALLYRAKAEGRNLVLASGAG